MLLEIIAFAMIFAGIILILRGITESPPEVSIPEEMGWERKRPKGFEEYEEEEWERKRKKTEVKAGGVVLIGPIPIVFGESKYAFYALLLTILLMFMVLLMMFGWRW